MVMRIEYDPSAAARSYQAWNAPEILRQRQVAMDEQQAAELSERARQFNEMRPDVQRMRRIESYRYDPMAYLQDMGLISQGGGNVEQQRLAQQADQFNRELAQRERLHTGDQAVRRDDQMRTALAQQYAKAMPLPEALSMADKKLLETKAPPGAPAPSSTVRDTNIPFLEILNSPPAKDGPMGMERVAPHLRQFAPQLMNDPAAMEQLVKTFNSNPEFGGGTKVFEDVQQRLYNAFKRASPASSIGRAGQAVDTVDGYSYVPDPTYEQVGMTPSLPWMKPSAIAPQRNMLQTPYGPVVFQRPLLEGSVLDFSRGPSAEEARTIREADLPIYAKILNEFMRQKSMQK